MKTITIDIGTTTIKCASFENGEIKGYFGKEYALSTKGKCVEQNPEDWCRILEEGLRQIGDISDACGISISAQGITILPVDENGTPLSPALSWLDTSAEEELAAFEKEFGAENITALTGKKVLPCYTLPKIKKMVDAGMRAAKFLMPLDYIGFLLTGSYYTDYTMASGTMLFDIEKRRYHKPYLDFCGITEEQLATPVEMGEKVGCVHSAAAARFGIPEGIPVIMGAQDQKISAYACKLKKGVATVSLGTSTAVSILEAGAADMAVFAYNGKDFIYESALNTTGAAIKWLKNLAFGSYEEMDACALEAGGDNGAVFDSDFTDGAAIRNLTLSVNRGHLVNALYQDIAKRIRALLPDEVSHLVLFGGGAKSRLLCDTIARVTGCTVEIPPSVEVALAGADLLVRDYYKREEKLC